MKKSPCIGPPPPGHCKAVLSRVVFTQSAFENNFGMFSAEKSVKGVKKGCFGAPAIPQQ